ncbi:MAG: hypothetical protein Q8P45_00710 [Candidatus Harrisonbacteria bacterium]|nr:hypothetical protein [Candidatus Harrisonbacteria bacterium]
MMKRYLIPFVALILILASLTCAQHVTASEHCGGTSHQPGIILCSGAGFLHETVLKHVTVNLLPAVLILFFIFSIFAFFSQERLWARVLKRKLQFSILFIVSIFEELFSAGILHPKVDRLLA